MKNKIDLNIFCFVLITLRLRTNKQTNKQTNEQTNERTNEQTNKRYGQMRSLWC